MVDTPSSTLLPGRVTLRWRIGRLEITPFWVLMSLIFVVAGAIRLLTFARGLPYVINVDEPNIYTTVQGWRGLFEGPMLEGYPPIVLWVSYGVQLVTEAFGHPGLASTVFVMRLLAVGYSLTTLILIALMARRVAGEGAALLAAAAWGVSTLITQESVAALADPIGYLLLALTLYLALVGAQDRRLRTWCVYSFLVGLVATLAKYPLFPVLLPAGLIALYVLLKEDRKRGLLYLGLMVLATVAVVLWLFLGYHVTRVFGQTQFATNSLKQGISMATFTAMFSNLKIAMEPIGVVVVMAAWLIGIAAYLYCARRDKPRLKLLPLALIIFMAVSYLIVSGLFTTTLVRPHDVYPVTSLICVLFGAAVWQISQTLTAQRPSGLSNALRWLPVAAAVLAGLLPQFIATAQYVQYSQYEDHHVAVRRWAQTMLDPGWVIVNGDHVRTFNTIFGGIQESKWFPWYKTNTIEEHTPEEWRAQDMKYAALEEWRVSALQATEAGKHYFDKLLLLRRFKAPPDNPGLDTLFYRLWRPQVGTTYALTSPSESAAMQINLVGYDLTDASGSAITTGAVAANDDLHLTLYWNAAATPRLNYSVFVHLSRLDSPAVLAQVDGSPALPERPTSTWDEPTETIIGQPFVLKLPADLPAGQYRVMVGMYDSGSGQRLALPDGAQEIMLVTITVS